jgi:hypothetical protein
VRNSVDAVLTLCPHVTLSWAVRLLTMSPAAGQGQGYITTNSQSVSMSWYRAQSRTIDQSLLSP